MDFVGALTPSPFFQNAAQMPLLVITPPPLGHLCQLTALESLLLSSSFEWVVIHTPGIYQQ